MDQRWTKIRELFRAALDLDEEQREAFLLEQCQDDPDMRDRVASMLKAYENEDTFLQSPVANMGKHFASKKGHEALVGTKVGSYLIKRVIAQGGMGVVFEAFDTKLEKIVALKMMNPALMQDESFKLRFEQEAKTLARLEDPHFVRVYALIEENHNTFIVMEYIHGITLAEHIRAKGKLNSREVASIGMQLLAALSKAHKQNIIHRDLKPSNIMLTRTDDGKPIVKVLDFGIAKNIQNSGAATRTMGTVGTLYYMSPEQIRALPDIDHRTDVYSSGVTLYEALNGSLPFDITKDEFTIRKQIVEGRLHASTFPEQPSDNTVEQVVAKALEIDRAERFQSADEMRAAFRAALQQYNIHSQPAPPAPPIERTAKNRNRPLRFIIPALALLIILPLVLYAMSGSLPFFQQDLETPEQALADNVDTENATPTAEPSLPETTLVRTEEPPTPAQAGQQTEPQESTSVLLTESAPDTPPQTANIAPLIDAGTGLPEGVDLINEDSFEVPTSIDTTVIERPDSTIEPQELLPAEPPLPTGDITLYIRPPGNLYVDNEDLGEINVEPLILTAETHRFVVQNSEYGTWECSLPIEANQSVDRYILFNQTITIPVVTVLQGTTTAIRDASIILDGVATGFETPMAIKVSPGLHSIGAQLDGYRQEDVVIEGAEGCFQKIDSSINFDSNTNYKDKRVVVVLSKTN